MEPRLKDVLEDLMELGTIREGDFVVDIKLDDSQEAFGLSLKTEVESGGVEELVWIEVTDNEELAVNVNPDVDKRTEYTQDLWAVLYCISANLKKKEGEVWGDLDVADIAEEIYDSRLLGNNLTKTLEEELAKGIEDNYETIPEEELPEELILDVEMDTLMDIIKEYGDKEAVIVVDFINKLTELNGLDIQIGVSTLNLETGEETEPEFYLNEEEIEEGEIKPVGVRREHGLLEQDYVIVNSTALIEELLGGGQDNNSAISFLNQLIFERVQIEKLLEAIFTEE